MVISVKVSLEEANTVARFTINFGSRGVHGYPVRVDRIRELMADSPGNFDIEHLIRNIAIFCQKSGLTKDSTLAQLKTAIEGTTFEV